jgi:hypothetical protein
LLHSPSCFFSVALVFLRFLDCCGLRGEFKSAAASDGCEEPQALSGGSLAPCRGDPNDRAFTPVTVDEYVRKIASERLEPGDPITAVIKRSFGEI